jgi:HK97 family phage portal protein
LTQDPETEQLVPVEDIINQKHPLEMFFEQPHPYFSWQTIQFIWAVHLKTAGEAFGIWDDNSEGRQIWPVNPTTITKLPTPDEPFFIMSLSTGQHEIPVDEMLWLLDPDPTAPYARGSGIAQALDDELSTDEEAAKTIRAFFENQARPDVLITGRGLNPEKTKKIEEEWKEKQSGFWNAFKPHFMSEQVDIREFKQDFQSMQFIELRKYERDTIIQVFGIPPEIIGILQNSNRATIEAADLFFARYTLDPILRQMREAYQKQIVPKFDDTGLIELDYISPIQEDKEYNLKIMQAAPYAFLVDEVRELAGQEAFPNGLGEKIPMPLNLTMTSIDEGDEEPNLAPIPGETIEPNPNAPAPTEPGQGTPPEQMPTEPTQAPMQPLMPPTAASYKKKGRRIRTGRGAIIRIRRG